MFKIIFALVAVLALAYFGLTFNGYQINTKNISYYLPSKQASSMVEIEFTNGTLFKGEIIEESESFLRVNVEGAVTSFPKSQIKTTRTVGGNFFAQYMETLRRENKIHPLISRKKGMSSAESMDKSGTSFLKTITQVDKLEQMEKLKKDIKGFQDKAESRNKQVEDLITI